MLPPTIEVYQLPNAPSKIVINKISHPGFGVTIGLDELNQFIQELQVIQQRMNREKLENLIKGK